MSNNKKGFILYADIYDVVKELSHEDAGELFKDILEFVNKIPSKTENPIVKLLSITIKQQLKRDSEKWEKKIESRKIAGLASAKARKEKKQQNLTKATSVDFVETEKNPLQQNEFCSTKSTVTVNDSVTVNVNDSVTVNDSVIKNKKPKKIFSIEVYNCFEKCLEYFPISYHPKCSKSRINWLNTIDQLNKIELLPFLEIEIIVKKARSHHFWSEQFQSLTKLRTFNKNKIMYVAIFNELDKFKENGKSKKTIRTATEEAINRARKADNKI